MTYNAKDYLAQVGLKSLGFNPGTLDGLWGAKSTLAFEAWAKNGVTSMIDSATPQSSERFDQRTETNIATLKPEAQAAARKFMAAAVPAMAQLGLQVRITSGYRSYAEQNALYAQGRTKPGPKVTDAPAGYSWHNFRWAFDITLFDLQGRPVYESPYYTECARIGELQGLDCGAYWKNFKDEPHYQVKTGKTMAQLREEVANGG